MNRYHRYPSRSYRSDSYHGRRGYKEEGKVPVIICTAITIFALIVLVLGFIFKNPYFLIAGIVPAAVYEAWRTEGFFTKIASVGILILVILEILAILGVININLASALEQEEAYFQGYYIPLGDIKFVFPAAAVVLAISLLFYTYGKYTKWLSVILVLSTVSLLYLVNREALIHIIKNFI